MCSRIACPAGRGLVGVGRADDVEARDRAQRGEVLDRLVGRTVLAEADGVVGPDVGDRQLHQRGEPHRRRACSRRTSRNVPPKTRVPPCTAMPFMIAPMPCSRMPKCSTRPAYGSPVHILVERSCGQERRRALDGGVVGLGQVGRAAPQLGQHRGDRVDAPRRRPCGWRRPCRRPSKVGSASAQPSGRVRVCSRSKSAGVGRGLVGPGVERLVPRGLGRLAALDGLRGCAR